jgi:4,5-DOPA dioxygenase extradiol
VISRRALLAVAAAVAVARPARADDAMPVAFVSHLSPKLAIDPVRGPLLRTWGASLPKPRGIVAMTPHYASRTMRLGPRGVGFAAYTFPAPMKKWLPPDLDYPSPPSAELAKRVEGLLCGGCQIDGPPPDAPAQGKGTEHTVWMPLLHMFPAHDVPVLEIAYPYLPDAELFALGRKLAPLRAEGVLVLASGGMTHNLASVDISAVGEPVVVPSWSSEFDAWAAEALTKRDADTLVDWRRRAPAAELAHPDDGGHFRVLLVALGAALHGPRAASRVSFPVTGFESTMSARAIEIG